MIKNPVINALLAMSYIVALVSAVFNSPNDAEHVGSIIMPIAILSLLVLSVAVMAYLFFYQPILLFIENKKTEAVHFFLKTVGSFAILTLLVLGAVYLVAL